MPMQTENLLVSNIMQCSCTCLWRNIEHAWPNCLILLQHGFQVIDFGGEIWAWHNNGRHYYKTGVLTCIFKANAGEKGVGCMVTSRCILQHVQGQPSCNNTNHYNTRVKGWVQGWQLAIAMTQWKRQNIVDIQVFTWWQPVVLHT